MYSAVMPVVFVQTALSIFGAFAVKVISAHCVIISI